MTTVPQSFEEGMTSEEGVAYVSQSHEKGLTDSVMEERLSRMCMCSIYQYRTVSILSVTIAQQPVVN